MAACRSTAGFGRTEAAGAAAEEVEGVGAFVGGGADISVGCFGWREGEKTACDIRMEAPPKFLEGLEKYFSGNLEGAKEDLTGDDLLSKALLVLVDVKLDDGSKNDDIQNRIDAMDFKENDIALMFCVLAQEYGLHMTKAHNLLLKRFGKEEKVIKMEEEMPELEPVEKPEAKKPEEPVAKPNPMPIQAGGKRVTRKPSSKASGKKRISRGKA